MIRPTTQRCVSQPFNRPVRPTTRFKLFGHLLRVRINNFIGRPLGNHLAVFEPYHPITQRFHLVSHMLHEHHRLLPGDVVLHCVECLGPELGVTHTENLVNQKDIDVGHQGGSERKP